MRLRFSIMLTLWMLLLFAPQAGANEPPERNLYSGGMLIFQPGYIIGTNPYQKISERSHGLGGVLRFYFGRYGTAGIYGSSHKTTYSTKGSNNSTLSLGYGGPFIGLTKNRNRFRFTLAAFAGRGTIRNLHINLQKGSKLSDASLHQHSAWIMAPIFSADYSITTRLVFTLQMACPTSRFNNQPLYAPTLQAGLLFSR